MHCLKFEVTTTQPLISVSHTMSEIGRGANGNNEVTLEVKESEHTAPQNTSNVSSSLICVPFLQKMVAEILGTYFLIFVGCGVITVNLDTKNTITFPGVAIVWGLVVMVMIYAVGHISGAHFNPAVTIAFAICQRFPWKQVPPYVIAQVLGSTLASGTIRLIFNGHQYQSIVSAPSGSNIQAVVIEFIITFYLMFVVSGVATDNRAIGELAGLAVGATILVNVMFAGPISGSSMNPARSLGPAIISNHYKGLWIYIVGPTAGAICGASVYNLIRFTDKPLREITRSGSFLKSRGSSMSRNSSLHR